MVKKVSALADKVQERISAYADLYTQLEEKSNAALAEAEKKADQTAGKLSTTNCRATQGTVQGKAGRVRDTICEHGRVGHALPQ